MKSLVTLLPLSLSVALLGTGCASFSRFGTARTAAVGESRWSVTLDGGEGSYDGETPHERIFIPTPHVRYDLAVAEKTELGFEAGIPGMLGFDVKRELIRTRFFDLAVAPGLTAGWYSQPLVEGHVPLLADLVITDWLIVVPNVSAGWGAAYHRSDDELVHGPLAGGGLGLYFRLGDAFALQPAFTSTWELDTLYVHRRIGLAISFGPQPSF